MTHAEQRSKLVERILEVLDYNPENGKLTWLVSTSKRIRVGDSAGSFRPSGYIDIKIDGILYKAHRIIWLWMTGEWPKHQIDHVDGTKTNNRWSNLREATQSQNQQNAKRRSDNKSGFKGVHWNKRAGKWHAKIKISGKVNVMGILYYDVGVV